MENSPCTRFSPARLRAVPVRSQRAASVRTLATVDWVAGYLDDPELAQTACKTIVELAHHRFLRQPNKAHFEPILRKVEATAKDKSVAGLAEKARLGM